MRKPGADEEFYVEFTGIMGLGISWGVGSSESKATAMAEKRWDHPAERPCAKRVTIRKKPSTSSVEPIAAGQEWHRKGSPHGPVATICNVECGVVVFTRSDRGSARLWAPRRQFLKVWMRPNRPEHVHKPQPRRARRKSGRKAPRKGST